MLKGAGRVEPSSLLTTDRAKGLELPSRVLILLWFSVSSLFLHCSLSEQKCMNVCSVPLCVRSM